MSLNTPPKIKIFFSSLGQQTQPYRGLTPVLAPLSFCVTIVKDRWLSSCYFQASLITLLISCGWYYTDNNLQAIASFILNSVGHSISSPLWYTHVV